LQNRASARPPLVAGFKESPASAKSLVAGFKGYGKAGNYGVFVPPPRPLDPATESAKGSLAPFARGPTEDEIAAWMSNFEILQPMVNPIVEVGQVVLWRGYKMRASGGASTNEEFFRGEVHRIIPDDGNGTRYVVS
jgi:hypothetical protein